MRLPVVLLLSFLSANGCLTAAESSNVVQEDRVIAGGPNDSLEVRHLVLRGTNEQIGRALAGLAKDRYDARLEASRDPGQTRAQRKFLERNDPILLDRMRGVAAAYGKSVEEDAFDFTTIGFTDLRAGCSIVHLPPSSMADGKSVVSRDYDFTTGTLSYGFLQPGMLHPTARPYLLELHPDRGYASIAMVAYDLLSGVLDGINSEGLTVTLAMDAQLFEKGREPTRGPAVGLGELQTLRLLLDTCSTVEEAKQALWATKQYYQYVPVHYLIADRFGNAFVWEYSEAHNQEYVIENPGQPLVMTNFTIHKQLENGKPPSAEKARPTCKRYAYLTEKLATEKLDDAKIREVHQKCDAQASQAVDPSQPPERTFWHAFYYPEDRKVRLSYYLRDEPYPGEPRYVKPVRTDYLEFKLEPTRKDPVAKAAPEPSTKTVSRDVEELTLANASVTDADVRALAGSPKLRSLGLMGASISDDALSVLKTLPALKALNVSGTKVTDAGLVHLGELSNLEYLGLKDTAVTDAGLAHLKDMRRLTTLNLANTQVTDAGLAHLAGMTRLESVNLSNDAVTDAGLAQLARVPGLAGINLTGTKITDAGLVQLKPIPKLTKLNVSGTAVTEQGVKDAKKFLPFWAMVTR